MFGYDANKYALIGYLKPVIDAFYPRLRRPTSQRSKRKKVPLQADYDIGRFRQRPRSRNLGSDRSDRSKSRRF
jgi:hypothetical protein